MAPLCRPDATICCLRSEKLLSSRSTLAFLLVFSSGSMSMRLSMLNFRFGFLTGSMTVVGAVKAGETGFGDNSSSLIIGGDTRR